jgi:hypothetical protein
MSTYEPHDTTVIELAGHEEMGVPRVDVVVHPTVDLLNDWRRHEDMDSTGSPDGDTDAESMGITTFDPDRQVPFEVHLAADAIYLSIVAHEATHVALWDYAAQVTNGKPGARASRHIAGHDETMPYGVGNLTALIWYQLQEAGFPSTDDAETEVLAPGIP